MFQTHSSCTHLITHSLIVLQWGGGLYDQGSKECSQEEEGAGEGEFEPEESSNCSKEERFVDACTIGLWASEASLVLLVVR